MKIENKNNLAPWGISAKEAGEYAKKLSLAVRKALEELAKSDDPTVKEKIERLKKHG